jgi:hypothetical protein
MIIPISLLVYAALLGIGATLVLRELLPSQPHLGETLARLDTNRIDLVARADGERGVRSRTDRVADTAGSWLLRNIGEAVRLPSRDLDLLGKTPARHLFNKAAMALYGLSLPLLLVMALTVAGIGAPFTLPAGVGMMLAGVFWFVPDLAVKSQAAEARAEFRQGVAAYLELVALERAADAGPIEALTRAAETGKSWVFTRIASTLARAQLAGAAPWEGLRILAEELDLPELADPAEIIAMAGEDGAAVYATLRARVQSLSNAILSEAETQANAVSEKIWAPVALLVVLMTAFIGYPAFSVILLS